MKPVTVEKLQASSSGATRAFVTFVANGIRVIDARIVDGSKGTFLAMPQKTWKDREEKTRYVNIIEFEDAGLKAEVERQVLAAWKQHMRTSGEWSEGAEGARGNI
jgi:DNA-binding cell septation regulator SpoVG